MCVRRVFYACGVVFCLNAEIKAIHNASCYTGEALTQVSRVKVKLPALTHCPMLLSGNDNDFKVNWVSAVHNNMFRQTTVANHL